MTEQVIDWYPYLVPVVYEVAPEVRAVGLRLIQEHHPTLRGTRVEFVFRSKAATRNGRVVGGSAKKITGVNALLATPGAQSSEDLPFFLITIAKDVWERLDQRKREALVDHELEHCRIDIDEDGDAHLTMRGHDIEEFASIVGRHGLWSDGLEWFVSSLPAEQLALAGTAGLFNDLSTKGIDVTVDGVRVDEPAGQDGQEGPETLL